MSKFVIIFLWKKREIRPRLEGARDSNAYVADINYLYTLAKTFDEASIKTLTSLDFSLDFFFSFQQSTECHMCGTHMYTVY